ncbi:hypothetical protein CONCODRAFT_70406 [Conidiobolus coronatus NRRL 28638]|uniref:Galactose oxidase n=1 Tax=Conidiobolus coronatus (strain ATCC 28846 / CBS 209.66 / NRRL 28638) TaxID=796925 RepID=A0A137P718_CONC2|nr:hypothetical protein CONCODRAFT_70406 [Conidiobolus coronatus NRRL 28638]|eukprot:KXN70734.1 hypothetical protein CONCODRAFT_70406 [Conidiobolus coronatus NRRL 28638]
MIISSFIGIIINSMVAEAASGLATSSLTMHTSSILINNTLVTFDASISNQSITTIREYNLNVNDTTNFVASARMEDMMQEHTYYETRYLGIVSGSGDNRSTFLFGSMKDNGVDTLVSRVNLTDLNVVIDGQLMGTPDFDSFPAYSFSSNILYAPINNNQTQNPTLFLFGGLWRSSNQTDGFATNQMISYDYTQKAWKDLSSSAKNSNVPFLSNHQSVAVDSRYIYMLGGVTISGSQATMNNLVTIWVYDTYTDSWTTKNTTNGQFNSNLNKLGRVGFSASVWRDSIVIYGGSTSEVNKPYNHYLGQLNLTTLVWNWTELTYGSDQKVSISYHSSEILGDKLILIHGQRGTNSPANPLFMLDLVSKRFVAGSLPDTPSSTVSSSRWGSIPLYAIILICAAIFFTLLLTFYIVYKCYWRRKTSTGIDKYQVTEETFSTDKHFRDQMTRSSFMEQTPHNSIYIPRQLSLITHQLCNINERTDRELLQENTLSLTPNDTSILSGDISRDTGITVVRTDGAEIQMTNERIRRGKVTKGQEIQFK